MIAVMFRAKSTNKELSEFTVSVHLEKKCPSLWYLYTLTPVIQLWYSVIIVVDAE